MFAVALQLQLDDTRAGSGRDGCRKERERYNGEVKVKDVSISSSQLSAFTMQLLAVGLILRTKTSK